MLEVFAVHTMPEQEFDSLAGKFMELLPPESAAGVLRFRRAADRQRSLLGEALARIRLAILTGRNPADLVMRRLEKGKPILENCPGYHFNVSHSGTWVVAAISDREVGIDVERVRDPQYRIAERFFSAEELEMLDRLEGEEKQHLFFDFWTLKESYLKLLGKGLTQSLGSFTLGRSEGTYRLVLNGTPDTSIQFRQFPLDPAYRLSVCCRASGMEAHFERLTVPELLTHSKW